MYGEKIKMYYDPRGQVIRTENPDGSEQRVVYGVPNALTTPQSYAPTAWETYTYDANDLTPTSADYGTPKSAEVDALGRTVKTLDRLESSNSITNNVRMQYSYDVRGNLQEVIDAYERTVFTHVYDLRPPAKEGEGIPPLKTVHINKGTSTVVFDCTGKPVETRDAKGALTLHTYDVLQRPTSVWCRDIDTEEVTLRNYVEYGTDNSNNNKGKNTYNYNESGLVRTEYYDFKGNLLTKFQQTIANEKIQHVIDESSASGWTDIKCYRVDWTDLPGDLLGSTVYRTDMTYDALNRLMQLTYPEDASSTRKVLVPTYNKAGALEQVDVDDIPYVTQIGYNAKGQRLIIAYGNGLMTRYTYNAQTFRLTRMRTEGYTANQVGNQHTYAYNSGTCKQDMAYTYDKVGNILSITNAAPQSGAGGSSTLEREFDYDALYRLLSATGRENQPTGLYWDDSYRSDDVNSTTAYTQNYDYDLMGNLNSLQHVGYNSYTREYNYADNLLESFEVGSNTYYYQYDVCGNQIQENEERHMQWDYADKLRLYYNQTSSGTEPSVYTHYLYDAGGNRVKKYTRTAGGNWETITYLDGLIEYREDQDGNLQSINHVMDDTKRIATIRDGYDFGDTTPKIKYNFDDHLGSSNILVDENGTLVNQEEYYPFGETSFGSYAKKRYRFCGKEKDEESGMYYYGARYYSPWLCRFISVDPLAAKYPFYTPFQYAGNKPINFIDKDGEEEYDVMLDFNTGIAHIMLFDKARQNTNTGNVINEVSAFSTTRDPSKLLNTGSITQYADIQSYIDSLSIRNDAIYQRNPLTMEMVLIQPITGIQQNASGKTLQPTFMRAIPFNPSNVTQMVQVNVPQSTAFTMVKAAGGIPSTVQTYQVTIPPSSTTATMTINAGMDSQISNSLVVTDSNNNVVSTTASSTNPNGQVFDTVNLTDTAGSTSIVVQPGQTYTFTVTAGSTTPADAYNITVTVGTTNPVMIPSTGNPQSIPPTNPTSTPVQPTTSR